MAVSGEQFGKALVASTLMTADELQAFWKALPEADRPKDGTALSKQLVAAGKLTQFQADQILAGRGAGLVLGDYVLMSKIGAGGMGQVFKAQHRVMERVVAIKLLPPSMVKDEAAVKRFQREVKAAAKLSHPNIVAALDARNERGVWYLVMEYVEGSDLSSLIKTRGPLPLDEALNYVRQAAAGLAFAHGKGVVHRDIKPANLLLDSDGVVKILDMGLARFDEGTAADHQLTNTGQVMGTVDYMAPEQAFDTRHADAKADVYSLGCSLYRLLVGDNVFGGDTVVQKILAHREQPIPDLRDRCPQANDAVNTLFQRMMAKKPEDRPTMAEIVGLIDAARGVTGGVSGATSNFNASDSNLNQFLQGLGGGSSTATGSSAYKTVGEEGMTEVMGNQKLRRIMGPDLTQSFSKPEAGTDPKSQVSFQGGPNQEQDSGSSKSKVTSRDRQGAAPPWKKPAVLIGGGAAAFLLIALGVWVIIRDKGGKEIARVEAPDGASVEVKTSAPGAFDLNLADRAVVEWICANQGIANIEMIGDGKIRNVDSKSAGKLPAETFALVACRFPKKVKPPAEIIKLLVDCKRLNEVDMNGVGLVDSDLAPWSKLPQLKTLNLPYNDLTATSLLALRNQRSLANLDIHNTKIEAKSAVGFAMAQPKLESLACNWDSAAIEAFVPPATLRKVILYDLSDTRAMRVGQWSKLETLVISSSGMLTEAGFKELCKLTNLRSLQFISGVPVENGWLVHLANLPQLEDLSLVQTKVTDAGIEQLARLKNLKSLSLTQTRVSSTGIVKLSQALPNCRIEKDGNVRGPGGASSASGIASSNIPAEALEFNGHRYLLVNVKTLWDKARAEAEALGGHLVTINSPAERDWIGETFIGPKRAVPLEGDRILLGGFKDDPSQPWQWVTGEPFDESLGQKKWANDSSGGRKVLSTHGATSWDDVRPNSTYAYVIEWDTPGGPQPIDLIARFDAAASTPAGAWKKDDSVLTSANGTLRLSVPSPAPDEYDLDLDFERVGKTNQFGINLGFMDQGRQPTLLMDDSLEARWCIVSVDKLGHNDAANPTRVAGVPRFEPGERHIVKLSVRRDGLRVVHDGTAIIDWRGKPEQLSTSSYFSVSFPNIFYITSRSPFKFHRITLTPVGAQPASTSTQPQAPNPSAVVYLDDLQESEWRNGYQTLGKHGHDNQGAPIVIGGDRLAHALFTHPASNSTAIVTYTLAGKYQSFVARVAMSYPEQSAFSGLSFRVVGDGRELWKSKTIQKPTDEDSFAVSVAGVKVLQLEVNCPGANARAHAVWIDPRLTAFGSLVDLLPLVDVKRDTVAGDWTVTPQGLNVPNQVNSSTGNKGAPRLQLPYTPPEEYDLLLELTPTNGANDVGCLLNAQGRNFSFRIDRKATGVNTWYAGFGWLDGKRVEESPASIKQDDKGFLKNDQRYQLTIEVRRDALRALIDGKLLTSWSGDWKLLSLNDSSERQPDATRLGLINYGRGATYHRVEVREISGRGTLHAAVAGAPAAVVYLDDVQEMKWIGYLNLGKHGTDMKGNDFEWQGVKLKHALFTHIHEKAREAVVEYELAGRFARFQTQVGLIRKTRESPVVFHVLGDGKTLWESDPITTMDKPNDADIDVRGVQTLRLQVTGSYSYSNAVWIDPRLTPVAAPAAQPSPTQGEGAGVVSPIERLLSADYEWTAPESLGPVVNAAASTYAPTLSDDRLSLIVFSYGKSGDKKNGIVEFRRPTIDGPWSDAVQVTDPGDGYPALRANGLMLLTVGDSPKNADGKTNRDLFVRTRPTRDAPWGPPSKLPLLNTEHNEYRPVISPDGLSLVFGSNRPGGVGAMDLWISRRADLNAAWQPPVSLGDKVNTNKEEHASQILADNQTILVNRGDGALFAAAPDVQGNYALKAVPLPAGVKVNKCWLSPDGATLYFDNYKPGGSSGEGANEIRLSRRVPKGSVASLPAVATASGAQPRTPNSTATGSAAATGTAAAAGSADRAAAEWVQSQQGTVDLIEPGKAKVTIKPGETLPTGPFQVQTIYFLGTARSIADDELAVLAGLKNLDGLYLGGLKGFTDAGLKHLAGLTSLTNFAIFYNDRIFDEGMKHLAALRKLETLEIAATRVTDKGLQVFLGCPLRKLSVGGRPAADNMLPVVVQFKQLDDLSLHGSVCTDANVQLLQELPALKRLNLLKTNLTNNGLKTIATLKVSDLYLEGDFTDAGLKHLESMPSLSRFSYRGGKFTASGLAALKKALPQCTITGDGEKK